MKISFNFLLSYIRRKNEMKHTLFLLVIFIFNFAITYGQIDTCWNVVLQHNPENNIFNPDSVMYDTCLCKNKAWLPPYCEYVYAKQWFGLDLPNGALNIPQAPRDSVILRNWRDIDSSFTDMREGFENLENIFGNFVFMKVYPDIIDTSKIASRYFNLRFDNYVKIDSASYLLHNIPDIETEGYLGRYSRLLSNLSEPSFEFGHLKNSGIKSKLISRTTHYHERSAQWNVFGMKALLAWEITKGSNQVVVQVDDASFEDPPNPSFTEIGHGIGDGIYQTPLNSSKTGDFYMKVQRANESNPVTNTGNGNIIYNEISSGSNWEPDPGFGKIKPLKINKGHGSDCMCIINPKFNEKGIVGVAPNCITIGTNMKLTESYEDAIEYYKLDIYNKIVGINNPNIISQSRENPHNVTFKRASMDLGITVAAYPTGTIWNYQLKNKRVLT